MTSLLVGIPTHRRANVLGEVLAAVANNVCDVMAEGLIDASTVYVYDNDSDDDTEQVVRRLRLPLHCSAIYERRDYGVMDKRTAEARRGLLHVYVDKFNHILDLGECYDHTLLLGSDHLMEPGVLRTMMCVARQHIGEVGVVAVPLVESESDGCPGSTGLWKKCPSGVYMQEPCTIHGRVTAPYVVVCNMMFDRRTCLLGPRYDEADGPERYEFVFCETVRDNFGVGLCGGAKIQHLKAGWTREKKNIGAGVAEDPLNLGPIGGQ